MATTPSVNHREVLIPADQMIVSKTDPKGRITYVNRTFMRVSGYNEEQSLGQPHNIIRHPDMPRGVYYLMWKTLQQGGEFFGFVKNLCANGDCYWAFANVTPDYDCRGRLIGYFSVRRPTPEAAKQFFDPLYRDMCQLEQRHSAAAAPEASAEYLLSLVEREHINYEHLVLGFLEGKSS